MLSARSHSLLMTINVVGQKLFTDLSRSQGKGNLLEFWWVASLI